MPKEVFMPLGSLLNAYSNVCAGSNKSMEEFLDDVDSLYEKALELCKPDEIKTIVGSTKNNIELPIK